MTDSAALYECFHHVETPRLLLRRPGAHDVPAIFLVHG